MEKIIRMTIRRIRRQKPQDRRSIKSADETCPICLLGSAEMPVETNCGHLFCGKYSTSSPVIGF